MYFSTIEYMLCVQGLHGASVTDRGGNWLDLEEKCQKDEPCGGGCRGQGI